MGRATPLGAVRVGCIGRRSPGRAGGRAGAAGRGRWKIGWPGTGRPGAGRVLDPAAAPALALALGGGAAGALYTGRGPVWGVIMRRGGPVGLVACAPEEAAAGAGGLAAAGAAGGGATAAPGAGGAGFAAGAAGATAAGATFGFAGAGGAAAGAAAATGAAAGLSPAAGLGAAAGGGAAGLAGGAAWPEMAFRTSPGLEILERSNLGLMSDSAGAGRAVRARGAAASACPRMVRRTFSATSGSTELECVFFSSTPKPGSRSRMALLLTSSSLARSLIRTLSIRPEFSEFPLSLHPNPLVPVQRIGLDSLHGASVLCFRPRRARSVPVSGTRVRPYDVLSASRSRKGTTR